MQDPRGGNAGAPGDERADPDFGSSLQELEAFAQRIASLQEVTAALARTRTLAEVAEVVASHGQALFAASLSMLYLREGSRLIPARRPPAESPPTDSPPGDATAEGWAAYAAEALPLEATDPLPQAVRSGSPVWLAQRQALLEAWPDARKLPALEGFVALPLYAGGAVVGGLAFGFVERPSLDLIQRDFFLTTADLCAQVVERARSFEAERRAHEALQRQQERLSLLARTGETLASTLDPREAVAELARLVVPTLADWCAIDEAGPDGRIQRLAVQHIDPDKVAWAHELAERYPPDPNASTGVPEVLRTGRTEWVPHIPQEVLQAAALDEEQLQIIRKLALNSYAVVPLVARGRTLGALTLVGEGERVLTEEEVHLAEELARRAGLALENARLYTEVARNEARMRALVDATATVVWTATPTGEVVEVSPSWLAFTGQTEQEYLGGGFADAIHPADVASALALWEEAVSSESLYAAEYRLKRADGGYAHTLARARPVRDSAGRVVEYIGCNVDITELRRAEAEARLHAETLSTVNEIGRLISAELDQQKLVQAVTDAATSLAGAAFGAFFYNVIDAQGARYTLYTVSGVPRSAFERFPMPRNTAVFAPTFAGEGIVRSDDITRDPRYGHNTPYRGMPEGHLPVRSYLAVPVISRSGEVLGGLFLGHPEPGVFDARAETLTVGLAAQAAVAIDNARLFEEAQRLIRGLEQANRELDQFAYATSHDLKAPLRGIASLAEWIEEDLGQALTEDVRRKLELLKGRIRRMEGLIQGILDFSRAGRLGGERVQVDVSKLLAEVIDLLAPAPPACIVAGPDLPVLWTEKVALQQVLQNLVGNALKHGARPDVQVRVDARDAGEHWEFRVSDNGRGIPPDYQERIWGIFQTLEPRDRVESTGIGLSIVRKIVEGRAGRTWVESSEGAGASFFFTWPKHDDRRAT